MFSSDPAVKTIFQDLVNLYTRHLNVGLVFYFLTPFMSDNYLSVWRSLPSLVSFLRVLLKFVVIYQVAFRLYISVFNFCSEMRYGESRSISVVAD